MIIHDDLFCMFLKNILGLYSVWAQAFEILMSWLLFQSTSFIWTISTLTLTRYLHPLSRYIILPWLKDMTYHLWWIPRFSLAMYITRAETQNDKVSLRWTWTLGDVTQNKRRWTTASEAWRACSLPSGSSLWVYCETKGYKQTWINSYLLQKIQHQIICLKRLEPEAPWISINC